VRLSLAVVALTSGLTGCGRVAFDPGDIDARNDGADATRPCW
jgi:hypothetical protein